MSPFLKLLGYLLILQFMNVQGEEKKCYINEGAINEKAYDCGLHEFVANCMGFTCMCSGQWRTTGRYKRTCRECRLSNDPHITTFDGAKYDWHGDCTYVVAQEQNKYNKVVSYIYNKFTKCGRASCVDTVHFKPRAGPIITVLKKVNHSPHTTQVVINGHSQKIVYRTDRVMQVLEGPENVQHRALAYWWDGCLHIIAIDRQDFLVKVCKYFVKIFSPKMDDERRVSGMCGSPDGGSANDDLKLRNGTVVRNPNGWGWSRVVDPIFAYDWQVSSGSCGSTSGRRRRSTDQEEEEPCKASDAKKAEYRRVCKEAIETEKSLSEDKRKDFIDGCAFDRCVITETGADADTIKQWLNEWTEVAQHEVFEQEHQEDITDEEYEDIDYLADYYDYLDDYNDSNQPGNEVTTTPAPELTCPISTVIEAGDKQFAFFTCPKTYTEARNFCKLYGWALATPDEQFEQFNERMPDDGEYWLDVQPENASSNRHPLTWYWQSSPNKTLTTQAQWKHGYYNVATINSGTNCASLFQNDGLLAFTCNMEWFFVCQSIHFFNVQQRSQVKKDVHVQRRVSPERNL